MITETLKAVAHFRKLADEELGQLAKGFVEQAVGAGETVYDAGEPADALFVVVRGTVVTFRERAEAGTRPLARLSGGDIVGVADFFDSDVRSEAARATDEARLLRGARDELLAFLETQPQVELNLRLAAARDLTTRAKIKLAVAQRRVVRHRINLAVELTAGGDSARATLIDLSTLGMSLRDAPERWRREDTVRYRLAWNDRQLGFVGRVAWREAEQVGIELQNPTPALQARLQETLEQMLSCAA